MLVRGQAERGHFIYGEYVSEDRILVRDARGEGTGDHYMVVAGSVCRLSPWKTNVGADLYEGDRVYVYSENIEYPINFDRVNKDRSTALGTLVYKEGKFGVRYDSGEKSGKIFDIGTYYENLKLSGSNLLLIVE